MDYADKLPPSPWYIFAPPRRYIFPPPLTIPFRSYGLDLGDSDLLALAQVQKMKQANLIERHLP